MTILEMIQQGEWFTLSGIVVFLTLLIIGFAKVSNKSEKKEMPLPVQEEGEKPVFVPTLTLGYNTVTAVITAAVVEHIRTGQTDVMAAISAAVFKYRNNINKQT
jgi:Na+-transporting methylmalonyl-CoA/oxaloacetate decarboxylase gamma subunit